MKLTRLWFLVPFLTLFFSFYLFFEVIPFGNQPFVHWWDVPAAISIIVLTVYGITQPIIFGLKAKESKQ